MASNEELLEMIKDLQKQINFLAEKDGYYCSECEKAYNGNAQCHECRHYTCETCNRYQDYETWFCSEECEEKWKDENF